MSAAQKHTTSSESLQDRVGDLQLSVHYQANVSRAVAELLRQVDDWRDRPAYIEEICSGAATILEWQTAHTEDLANALDALRDEVSR